MDYDNHCWQTCQNPECEICQELIDEGIVMGCDASDCGARGHVDTDAGSWRIMPDGVVLCISCFEQLDLPDMFGDK